MIWYLIIVSHYSGHAMVAIPQLSKEQCVANVEFVRKREFTFDTYCLPGAPK